MKIICPYCGEVLERADAPVQRCWACWGSFALPQQIVDDGRHAPYTRPVAVDILMGKLTDGR